MTRPFVSFAQNFEDVMLWRALKHVVDGFYVDVGAYAPVADSVTEAFYERGWHGINIEPQPDLFAAFLESRPRDLNLNVAISDREGNATLNVVGGTGLSTLNDEEASARSDQGHAVIQVEVAVQTLRQVWANHIAPNQAVHFLKVDVEGLEREVLLGGDWQSQRPWVVVIEATRPTSSAPSFEDWQGILLGNQYRFVYADGLNRFYVAEEHWELAASFEFPPNVFDQFVRASDGQGAATAALSRTVQSEQARAAEAESRLQLALSSRSWRVTRPLRLLARFARAMKRFLDHESQE